MFIKLRFWTKKTFFFVTKENGAFQIHLSVRASGLKNVTMHVVTSDTLFSKLQLCKKLRVHKTYPEMLK